MSPKRTLKTLDELAKSKNKVAIIHYASTSIFGAIEITQIAVRDYGRRETHSFGHTAEANEREILIAWGSYVKTLRGYTFVGWNFHSSTFGIPAMEARWKANNITEPFPIKSADVVDLDELLTQKFGPGYMTGPEKLRRLSDLNGATTTGFVPGKDEPQLYASKEFQRLMLSTERKVAMIAHLFALSLKGSLVVTEPPKKPEDAKTSPTIFGVILTLSAVLQIVSYAFVILYSVAIGSIDYVIPVKVAYVSTIGFLLALSLNDINKAYNNRGVKRSEVGVSLYRFFGELVPVIALLGAGAFFLFRPIYPVSLTSQGLEVRGLVTLGIVTSLLYPLQAAYGLLSGLGIRMGKIPKILTPQPTKDTEEAEE